MVHHGTGIDEGGMTFGDASTVCGKYFIEPEALWCPGHHAFCPWRDVDAPVVFAHEDGLNSGHAGDAAAALLHLADVGRNGGFVNKGSHTVVNHHHVACIGSPQTTDV